MPNPILLMDFLKDSSTSKASLYFWASMVSGRSSGITISTILTSSHDSTPSSIAISSTKYRSRFFRLLDIFDQTHSTLESATNEITKRFGELEAKLGSFLVDKKTPTAVHITSSSFAARSKLHNVMLAIERKYDEADRKGKAEFDAIVSNDSDIFDQTPLHFVASNRHLEVVKLLVVELKADVHAKDRCKKTLHEAVTSGRPRVVSWLGSCGRR